MKEERKGGRKEGRKEGPVGLNGIEDKERRKERKDGTAEGTKKRRNIGRKDTIVDVMKEGKKK